MVMTENTIWKHFKEKTQVINFGKIDAFAFKNIIVFLKINIYHTNLNFEVVEVIKFQKNEKIMFLKNLLF